MKLDTAIVENGRSPVTRSGAGRQSVSEKKDWGTPRKYVDAIRELFNGVISLDPCSNSYSIVEAEVEYRLPDTDGLRASWDYPKIYVNPPYGNDKVNRRTIKHWLERCAFAHAQYGSNVLALVPVAVNTSHWKTCVFQKALAVCFLYDTRVRFLEDGKDTGKGAPMACAIVYWGKDYVRFEQIFLKHGAVISLAHLHGRQIGKPQAHRLL